MAEIMENETTVNSLKCVAHLLNLLIKHTLAGEYAIPPAIGSKKTKFAKLAGVTEVSMCLKAMNDISVKIGSTHRSLSLLKEAQEALSKPFLRPKAMIEVRWNSAEALAIR
jgi:hypothetical protein